jgi:uncharacterized protein (TIGR00730 family)
MTVDVVDPMAEKKIPRGSVCVFCGSAPGGAPEFMELARATGALLARLGLRVVYGGSRDGCMGAVADGALEEGGHVLGILPEVFIPWEIAHPSLTELRWVSGMAERKALMMAESDVFLVLPGGLGTLDELFEVVTFNALGYMRKPVLILDAFDFYAGLVHWLERVAATGFAKPMGEHFLVARDLGALESFLRP